MNRLISLLLVPLALGPALAQLNPPERVPHRKLEINSATTADLLELPGIGPARAEWVVHTRLLNGPFRCVAELRAMPGLSERQFQALYAVVHVEAPDARCQPEPQAAARK